MGSGVPCPELGGDPLVAVVSWNQVERIDLTPVTLPESVLLTLSRRRLWYIGGSSMQGRIRQRIGHSMQHGGLWA